MSRAKTISEIKQHFQNIPQPMIDALRARKRGARADFIAACRPAIDLLPDERQGTGFLIIQAAAEWLEDHSPRQSVATYLTWKLWKGHAPRPRGCERPTGSERETGRVAPSTNRSRRSKGQVEYRAFTEAPRDRHGRHFGGWDACPHEPTSEYIAETFERLEDNGFRDTVERDVWLMYRAGASQAKIGQELGIPQRTISRMLETLCERFRQTLGDDKPVRWAKARKNRRARGDRRAA